MGVGTIFLAVVFLIAGTGLAWWYSQKEEKKDKPKQRNEDEFYRFKEIPQGSKHRSGVPALSKAGTLVSKRSYPEIKSSLKKVGKKADFSSATQTQVQPKSAPKETKDKCQMSKILPAPRFGPSKPYIDALTESCASEEVKPLSDIKGSLKKVNEKPANQGESGNGDSNAGQSGTKDNKKEAKTSKVHTNEAYTEKKEKLNKVDPPQPKVYVEQPSPVLMEQRSKLKKPNSQNEPVKPASESEKPQNPAPEKNKGDGMRWLFGGQKKN